MISKKLLVCAIAAVAHEVNRAYGLSIGDASIPVWADAPENQKESILAGVEMHLDSPDTTPEQSHEAWLARKLEEGWTYAEVKNVEAKQHPCILPYDQLPPEQKSKDYLFRGVVHALAGVAESLVSESLTEFKASEDFQALIDAALLANAPDTSAQTQTASAAAPSPQFAGTTVVGFIAVKYVGSKEIWKDSIYKSGLTFLQGQVRNVPLALARKFLRHADVFEESVSEAAAPVVQDDTETILEQAELTKKADNGKKLENQVIDLVNSMDKPALVEYASKHYGLKLNKSKSEANLRIELTNHISQVGVV